MIALGFLSGRRRWWFEQAGGSRKEGVAEEDAAEGVEGVEAVFAGCPRMRQKFSRASKLRKVPEIFWRTFIMRRSRSARLLSKGTAKSWRNARMLGEWSRKRSWRLRSLFCLGRPRLLGPLGGWARGFSAEPSSTMRLYRVIRETFSVSRHPAPQCGPQRGGTGMFS